MKKYKETPDLFKENLKLKILTKDMLAESLYSCNKSAKNARDKAKKYSRKPKYAESYYKIMESNYARKNAMLSILKPKEIHKVTHHRDNTYKWFNHGNPILKDYYDDYDCAYGDNDIIEFFLYFEIDDFKFHSPIESPDKYNNLQIIDIGSLSTKGCDTKELLNPHFTQSLTNLIKSGNYTISEDLSPYIK